MEPSLLASFAQFGTAGLVGWMWLTERRGAAQRDKQLSEAHERLMQERASLEALLTAIRENTRVLAQIEGGQRTLISIFASRRVGVDGSWAHAQEAGERRAE
ncbi:MAG: hypothetical protein U0637_02195 [Phycisphaerales bacterium]